jgi:hypothetical protein
MSSNNGWSGQLPVQHTIQQNQQVAGIHQGHMQASFQNQASAAQPMNPFQQVIGPQVTANMPIAGDRVRGGISAGTSCRNSASSSTKG